MSLSRRGSLEKLVFMRSLRAGDIVLEVGANRGEMTTLFSHVVGPAGHVHAFEPVPPTFERLRQKVAEEMRSPNVTLNNCAVGDAAGTVTLHMPGDDDGQASLRQHSSGTWERATQVKSFEATMIRLDDYVAERGLKDIHYLKVDVEGAELMVLKGATALLADRKPLIHMEVCAGWTQSFGYSTTAFLDLLMPLGYTDFYLYGERLRRLEDPATALRDLGTESANLLCTHTPLHQGRLAQLL